MPKVIIKIMSFLSAIPVSKITQMKLDQLLPFLPTANSLEE
jgi:hypothetical protein